MLDDQTFKTVIRSTPLISIDLLVKKDNKIYRVHSNATICVPWLGLYLVSKKRPHWLLELSAEWCM